MPKIGVVPWVLSLGAAGPIPWFIRNSWRAVTSEPLSHIARFRKKVGIDVVVEGRIEGVVVPFTFESSALSCAVKATTSFWRDEIDEVAGEKDESDVVAILDARDVPIDPAIGPLPPPPSPPLPPLDAGVEQTVVCGVTVTVPDELGEESVSTEFELEQSLLDTRPGLSVVNC